MAQLIFEGTEQELLHHLTESNGDFAGLRLQVFAEPEVDYAAGIPDPPFTVRTQAELEALLVEAADSPTHEVTEETWDYIRAEVRKRHAMQKEK